jgi:ribosome maturation factor RimP
VASDGVATVRRLWEIAEPLVVSEGMEIVDVEFRDGGKKAKVVRFFLDKPGGPSLDDLTRVSRQLSDLLDVEDPVAGPYTLEVSSPGVNRVLKRPSDFARFVGKRIRVHTREWVRARRSFLGTLKAVSEGDIVVSQEGVDIAIPLGVIQRANYEHDWEAEPLGPAR